MSLTELQITAEKDEIFVSIEIPPSVNVTAASTPELNVILAGNIGPPGPQGQWVSLTQAEYNALNPPDSETLYVIVE